MLPFSAVRFPKHHKATDLTEIPNSQDSLSIIKQTHNFSHQKKLIDFVVNFYIFIQITIHGCIKNSLF